MRMKNVYAEAGSTTIGCTALMGTHHSTCSHSARSCTHTLTDRRCSSAVARVHCAQPAGRADARLSRAAALGYRGDPGSQRTPAQMDTDGQN